MPHYEEELHTSDGSISSLLKKEGLNTALKTLRQMKEKISACEGKCFGVFIKERRFSAGPEVFSPP